MLGHLINVQYSVFKNLLFILMTCILFVIIKFCHDQVFVRKKKQQKIRRKYTSVYALLCQEMNKKISNMCALQFWCRVNSVLRLTNYYWYLYYSVILLCLGWIMWNNITHNNIIYLQESHENQESRSHLCSVKMFAHHQKQAAVGGRVLYHDWPTILHPCLHSKPHECPGIARHGSAGLVHPPPANTYCLIHKRSHPHSLLI